MSAPLPPPPGPGGGAPDEDFDRYAPRLLLWLWERAPQALETPVHCADFGAWQRLEPEFVRALVNHLASYGFLRPYELYGGWAGGDCPVVLQPAGAEQARRLRARRDDPDERRRYAQRAVLEWLRYRPGHEPPRLSEFFDSPQLFFLGLALSRDEVEEAVSYLAGVELVERGEGAPDEPGGPQVSLTDSGREFVWGGTGLDEYVRQRRERQRERAVVQTHIHGAEKVQIAGGDLYSSDVSFSVRLRPADLAVLVRRLAPDLELDGAALRELLLLSEELARQDGDGDGGPGANGHDGDSQRRSRWQQLAQRIRNLLTSASEGAVQQLLLHVVTQALR